MDIILNILIFLSLGVVVFVLFGGLISMARGNHEKSNIMMRYRVIAQAGALAVIAISLWLKQAGAD
ncbi:twin transmembrane helix small protein [Kiloniella sp. b19]|uniref:twin transmembrane helix small protein n=1 Tax=Kiloniella sp. GXU_MW_B19 TaxID=3141326 RepID=UPI0031DB46BC